MSQEQQSIRKLALAKAAIALAERSQDFTARARIQSDLSWGAQLMKRAYRQQKAALRLIRLASVT